MNNEEKILEMLGTILKDQKEMRSEISAMHSEITKGFQATRSELVDAVEAVGRKVEHLETVVKNVEDATAQNAFDVQVMKRRA